VSKVKENTLRKVEDFFAKETSLRGNAQVQVKLDDLKRETKLSLVTLYKALDDLVEQGKLEILGGSSRRSPKVYRYLSKFEPSDLSVNSSGDIGSLTKIIDDLVRQIQVKDEVIDTLREKLAKLEEVESNVLYRLRLADNTEVVVRKLG
jgi:DNA-binding PadR family transcriptional regulator